MFIADTDSSVTGRVMWRIILRHTKNSAVRPITPTIIKFNINRIGASCTASFLMAYCNATPNTKKRRMMTTATTPIILQVNLFEKDLLFITLLFF